MKITKQGVKKQDVKWVGSCRVCNTEFEADGHEITHEESDWRGTGESFSWEICEHCGAGDKLTGYGGVLLHPKRSVSAH